MDKTLIAIAILLGSILVIENLAMGTQSLIFITWGKSGYLGLISIFLGIMLGYGVRGLMGKKGSSEYDEDDGF